MKLSILFKSLKQIKNRISNIDCCIAIEENDEVRIYPIKGIGVVKSKDNNEEKVAIFIQETNIEDIQDKEVIN